MKKQLLILALVAGLFNQAALTQEIKNMEYLIGVKQDKDRIQAFATVLFYDALAMKLEKDLEEGNNLAMEIINYSPEKPLRAAFSKVYKGTINTAYQDAINGFDKLQPTDKAGKIKFLKEWYSKAYEALKGSNFVTSSGKPALWGNPNVELPAPEDIEKFVQ